jgi:hypothetical protein
VVEHRYTDEEHAFYRSLIWAEEDRTKFTTAPWGGCHRWYRNPDIHCLEHYRRANTAQCGRKDDAALGGH